MVIIKIHDEINLKRIAFYLIAEVLGIFAVVVMIMSIYLSSLSMQERIIISSMLIIVVFFLVHLSRRILNTKQIFYDIEGQKIVVVYHFKKRNDEIRIDDSIVMVFITSKEFIADAGERIQYRMDIIRNNDEVIFSTPLDYFPDIGDLKKFLNVEYRNQ